MEIQKVHIEINKIIWVYKLKINYIEVNKSITKHIMLY